jgi:thiol-disulfide isomerase/thioredoxin
MAASLSPSSEAVPAPMRAGGHLPPVTPARQASSPHRFPRMAAPAVRSNDVASRRLPLSWLVGATVVVLVAVVAVVVLAGGDDDAASLPDRAEVAALALAPHAGGPEQSLGDVLDDQPMVLNLFASWCQPCIEEMPDFQRVHQDLADRVDFAGLAILNPPEDALGIVERTGVTYPTFGDAADAASELFGVVNMPTTVFIQADGTVTDVHTGPLTEDELRAAIGDQLGVTP